MLKNLNELAIESKSERDKFSNHEIILSENFKTKFKEIHPTISITFNKHTCEVLTERNLKIIFPNQWFVIASFFTDYMKELFIYKNWTRQLNFSDDEIKLLKKTTKLTDEQSAKIETSFSEKQDRDFFVKFLTDYKWWFGSKTIERGDFYESPILSLGSLINNSNNYVAILSLLLCDHEVLQDALNEYDQTASDDITVADSNNLKEQFTHWLIENKNNNYFSNNFEKTLKALSSYEEKYKQIFCSDIFNVNTEQLDDEIRKIRENIWNEESLFWQFSKAQSTHQPRAILGDENYLRFLVDYKSNNEQILISGYNKIYFGAPGTGKSYSVAQQLKGITESQVERVIFHPDYDYSSFVGGYKPVTEKDEEDKEVVKYKFVPQVFTNIFEKAHRYPNKNFYLVIEEINRGNCAEIFGDIFQLLDRNPDYAITPSEDLNKYFLERDKNSLNRVLNNGKMIMPDNLIILATMNTSDQSLYPMDSAFKRRWDWEYVPIKLPEHKNDNNCPSFKYMLKLDDITFVRWIHFVEAVNWHILQNPSLGLDKCIGNFFVKPDKNGFISLHTLINKVIFYLWNDVFKDEENEIFKDHTYSGYFPIESDGLEKIFSLIDMFQKQGIFQIEKVINDLTETPKSIDKTAQ